VSRRLPAALVLLGATLAGCGGSGAPRSTAGIPPGLLAQARPIGVGPRFHPPLPPEASVIGACRRRLGRRFGVHVEIFAANRVVLLPAGMGTRSAHVGPTGRVSGAKCYGTLVTLDPTGVVLVRAGSSPRLGDLFHAWGQPLSTRQIASFRAATDARVSVYVDGRRRYGPPATLPLARHAEIVLEIGPHVPPHRAYRFPRGI
jgi:hypothetical protein